MNIKHLNVGILHSLIGKNDGVSIVIDQTVNAMVKDMGVSLGNIYFLAAHSSPRFNAETDDIFWHKNAIHKKIIKSFSSKAPPGLDKLIHESALYAKKVIADFVKKNEIDLLIAHNTSHPYNFITAVGLGYYLDEIRTNNIVWPNVLVWWHDSYYERDVFKNANPVIEKYLKHLPGVHVDGIAFINNSQIELGKRWFANYNGKRLDAFFKERAVVVPNTSEIDWEWRDQDWNGGNLIYPNQDNYNDSFFKDVGLIAELQKRDMDLDDAVILLQHTRVVPRKRIEVAIDLAMEIEKKYLEEGLKKCVTILVSGHSGDEQFEYKKYLKNYMKEKLVSNPKSNVVLLFGENIILSHRDIIVDKKYYKFAEIPAVCAAAGAIGTFFSEVEGFGNNLLEMMSFGLPVVINRYDVYKQEIEQLDFKLPAIDDGVLTDELVSEAFRMLNDLMYRNKVVKHNLEILSRKLCHEIIAEKLSPLIVNMFTKVLNGKVSSEW
jgi:glycosyltransferase involved in cell wall biosynthesis